MGKCKDFAGGSFSVFILVNVFHLLDFLPPFTPLSRFNRGSDELLTHGNGPAVSNGNALNAHSGLVDNNNDAKKAKLDKSAGKPSKVIHLRNIPSEVSEAEIIHLGIPFGRVTNVLVLKGKNQIELET
ncbi:hypothetical protein PGB90_002353 [Kerria lacca]